MMRTTPKTLVPHLLIGFSLATSATVSADDAPPHAEPSAAQPGGDMTPGMRLLPQPKGLANLTYRYVAPATIDWDGSGRVSSHYIQARGGYPVIQQSRQLVLLAGLNYQLDSFAIDDFVTPRGFAPSESIETFHRLGVTIGGLGALADHWTMLLAIEPRLATDFDAVDDQDLEFNGYALLSWAFADDWSAGLGIGTNRMFFQYRPLPLLQLTYRDPDSPVELDAFLPNYIRLSFRTVSWLTTFALGRVDGALWHRDPEANDLTINGIPRSFEVPSHFYRYFSASIGGGLRFKVGHTVAVDLHAGMQAVQLHEFRDPTNNLLEIATAPSGYGMADVMLGKF